jgi:hypothetical protein
MFSETKINFCFLQVTDYINTVVHGLTMLRTLLFGNFTFVQTSQSVLTQTKIAMMSLGIIILWDHHHIACVYPMTAMHLKIYYKQAEHSGTCL